MSQRSFSTGVAWAVGGNAAYALSQWGVTIALAKLGTPAMVGQFALALALTNPFIVLSLLQLRGVIVTEAGRRHPFSDFLALRTTLSGAAFVLAVLFTWAAGYPAEVVWTAVGVGAWKALDAICDIHFGRWQAAEEMDRVSRAMALNGVVSLAAVVVALLLSGGVVGAALASALGSAITLAWVTLRPGPTVAASPPAPGGRWRRVARLGLLAAPLGVVMALMSVQASLPRWFIERELGVADLGLFAAANQLTLAGGSVVTAFATVASPRLARHRAVGDLASFRSLLSRLAWLGLGLGACGAALSAVAGGPILSALYRPEYAGAADVLVWLSAAAGLAYAGSFLGYGMTIAGVLRAQAPLFLAVLAVTGVCCAALVPGHGVRGAAAAMGLAALVQVLGSVALVRRALAAAAGPPGPVAPGRTRP